MNRRSALLFVSVVSCALFMSGCAASPNLVSIQVTPGSASIVNANGTVQFTAMGTFARGKHPSETQDITAQVTWASSNAGTATINSAGVAAPVSDGTTSITATMNSSNGLVTATADLDVNISGSGGGTPGTRDLTGITLIPANQTINGAGNSAQFTALGTFSAAPTTQTLSAVTWQSSNTSVATIDASSGLATAGTCPTSSCGTTITATSTAQSGATIVGIGQLTVVSSPPTQAGELTDLKIVPSSQTLNAIGDTAQFIAIGTFNTSPTTRDVSTSIQTRWESSSPNIASIDSTGLARGLNSGMVTISATYTNSDNTTVNTTVVDTATLTENATGTNPTPSLTISVIGQGMGKITSSPNGISCTNAGGSSCVTNFVLGSTVTLTAIPNTGSSFSGWSSNCTPVSGHSDECTITMGGNQSVGAIFDSP